MAETLTLSIAPSTSEAATGPTKSSRTTTRTPSTIMSTTVYTSVVTQTLSGTDSGPVIVTVTATSVDGNEDPLVATVTTFGLTTTFTIPNLDASSATTPWSPATSSSANSGNTAGGTESTTKIALGVGIPLGIILVVLLIAGAYIWGRRANQASKKADAGDGLSGRDAKDQGIEMHELLPDDAPQELPTKFNLTEMPALEGPQEVAAQSPVELPGNENDR